MKKEKSQRYNNILYDKVVVITGASSGIGFSCAEKFCSLGYRVIINSHSDQRLNSASLKLLRSGYNFDSIVADVRIVSECKKIIDFSVEKYGKIDVLINNAGVYKNISFEDHSEEDFDLYFDTLIKGPFFLSKFAVPYMASRSSTIVNIGAIWAMQGFKSHPCAAYSAAKAALHSLTATLSIELSKNMVRVVGVAPGLIKKNSNLHEISEFSPIGYDGLPRDISEIVVYLTSEKAFFINGVVIPVDGGVLAGRHSGEG